MIVPFFSLSFFVFLYVQFTDNYYPNRSNIMPGSGPDYCSILIERECICHVMRPLCFSNPDKVCHETRQLHFKYRWEFNYIYMLDFGGTSVHYKSLVADLGSFV